MIVYLRELVHHLEDGLRELQLGALVVGEQPGERLAVGHVRLVQLLHDLVQWARVEPVLRLRSCWTRRTRSGYGDTRRRIHFLWGLFLSNGLEAIV